MTTPNADAAEAGLDLWAGCPRAYSDEPDDPGVPPLHWWRLKPATRSAICETILRTLADHPTRRGPGSISFLSHRAWEAMRAVPGVERELGRHTEIPNATWLIGAAVRKVLRAGNVREGLVARRAAIDAALTALDRMRVAAPAPVAEPEPKRARRGLFGSAPA